MSGIRKYFTKRLRDCDESLDSHLDNFGKLYKLIQVILKSPGEYIIIWEGEQDEKV